MRTVTILLLVASLLAPSALAAADDAAEDVPSVVVLRSVPEDLQPGSQYLGKTVLRVDAALGFVVLNDKPDYLQSYQAGGVLAIEPDAPIKLTDVETPDDPLYERQYGPQQVKAPEAWALTKGSVETTICVVDTGVRHTHEDLRGPRWLGGYDFVNDDADPMDDNGHGTHVAGTAAASIDNGEGIVGVAEVGLYGVKVLDADGGGYQSWVASGIRWCADHDANVISLSLGGSRSSATMQLAVQYATEKGSLVVAAAGNDGPCEDCIGYPAAYPEALAVTCTDHRAEKCSFSNAGAEAELAAPGYGIVSTWSTGDSMYRGISGTSMSTPHVSGVAALVWSAAPHLTNEQVRATLTATATDLGPAGHDADFGHGLVNAEAAVRAVLGDKVPEQPPAAPTPEEPTPEEPPAPEPKPAKPPVAEAGASQRLSDADGDGRETVVLNASGSKAADNITKYEWFVDGERVAEGEVAEATLDVGRHRVTLRVTAESGLQDTDATRVSVYPNRDPNARIAVSCDGNTCTFDASGSRDREGPIAQYEWDFDDGTNATGVRVQHTFEEDGWYNVELRVTDQAGRTDDTQRRVTLFGFSLF